MLSKAMEKSLKTFFSSPQFAVVGASSDPTKFGHKGKITFSASADLHDSSSRAVSLYGYG